MGVMASGARARLNKMEFFLGRLFGSVLLLQTILIFSPLPFQNGEAYNTPINEIQYAIDFNIMGNPESNHRVPFYQNQYDFVYQNWTTFWTIGTVIPALIVYKRGGSFVNVFSIGVLGWTIAKVLQALTYKGPFYKNNPDGEYGVIGSPQVRAMTFWKRAFEVTAYGTMAAAFITLRETAV
jgi:hypothetical protein